MNRSIRDRWVAALRSGQYRQGRGRLRTIDNTFCCLGVLVDLCAQEHSCPWGPLRGSDYSFQGLTTSPSIIVNEWADLPPAAIATLICLNDDKNATFPEIAAYIEENL